MEKAETIDTAMPEEMIKRQPDTDYGELVKIEYGSHLTTKLRQCTGIAAAGIREGKGISGCLSAAWSWRR